MNKKPIITITDEQFANIVRNHKKANPNIEDREILVEQMAEKIMIELSRVKEVVAIAIKHGYNPEVLTIEEATKAPQKDLREKSTDLIDKSKR